MNITSLIAAVTLAAIKVGETLPLKQAVSQWEEMGQVPAAEIKWLTSNGQRSATPPCAPAVTCQHPTCPALRRSQVGLHPRLLQGPKRQVQKHQR